MAVVALGSVRSCGVTTLTAALGAVWPNDRRRLVVELDPGGGTLVAQFGLRPEPGLVSLAAASRRRDDPELIWEHVQQLVEGADVLAAPPSAAQARAALDLLGALPAQLARLEADVFIDCGRLGAAPIADEAFDRSNVALLLVRPLLPDLHCVAAWLEARTELASSLGLVLVGEGPYNKTDVDHALHIEVLGDMPVDPDGVAALISASSRRRSPLLRHTRSIAAAIREHFTMSEPAQQSELTAPAAPQHPETISTAVGIVEREESRS
jgi:hypothetical protein